MSTAEKLVFHSVEAYLKAEEISLTRSEYINGLIRAMTGATNRHNTVSVNIVVSLGRQLNGRVCRPFNSDTKVRVRKGDGTCFYYPDVSVVCESNRATETFRTRTLVSELKGRQTRPLS